MLKWSFLRASQHTQLNDAEITKTEFWNWKLTSSPFPNPKMQNFFVSIMIQVQVIEHFQHCLRWRLLSRKCILRQQHILIHHQLIGHFAYCKREWKKGFNALKRELKAKLTKLQLNATLWHIWWDFCGFLGKIQPTEDRASWHRAVRYTSWLFGQKQHQLSSRIFWIFALLISRCAGRRER